ncbi:MAG: glycolate oxidase subunit GlcF [Gammaproteobacteria bacterium]|nr:glycolate oxidase subunit GlcF [Gammaproteobacteria bacterium]
MQTKLSRGPLPQPLHDEAESILRSCVHCGFCTATCPTYQLLGNELDSPRGRIYLIKQMFEGQPVSRETQTHLDRCLSCRNCETTCPSGVQYSRLLDLGREHIEHHVPRPMGQRLQRHLLRRIVPHTEKFSRALRIGRRLGPLLPARLRQKLPAEQNSGDWPKATHPRRMLLLSGCVQQATRDQTNRAMARLLDAQGISLQALSSGVCCGAVNHHAGDTEQAKIQAKHNIDLIFAQLQQGAEAVLVSASGCGSMIKEYGRLLQYDSDYVEKAAIVSDHCKDLCQVLDMTSLGDKLDPGGQRIAFQSPCSLQHGQKLAGRVEQLLSQAGFILLPVENGHTCCGSAGSYSLLQPELSQQLLHNKLQSLQRPQPEAIVTANIGCELHLASQATIPVIHWIDLLARQLRP